MLLVADPEAFASFGEALRFYRKKAGLSQERLAKAAGVHRVDVTRYEGGSVGPTFAVAWRLADALGISVSQLPSPEVSPDSGGESAD